MVTPEQFEQVCQLIETTTLSLQGCMFQVDPKMHREQFYRFLRDSQSARDRYARSKDMQLDIIADEMLDIADDGSNDLMTIVKGNVEYETENKETARRSALRIDTRKWLLSKLNPKKYGDRVDLTTNGKDLLQPPSIITYQVAEKTS